LRIVPILINFNEVEIGAIPAAIDEKKMKAGIALLGTDISEDFQ
jgi:hypothetical protein